LNLSFWNSFSEALEKEQERHQPQPLPSTPVYNLLSHDTDHFPIYSDASRSFNAFGFSGETGRELGDGKPAVCVWAALCPGAEI
jgi:hypothetical protein